MVKEITEIDENRNSGKDNEEGEEEEVEEERRVVCSLRRPCSVLFQGSYIRDQSSGHRQMRLSEENAHLELFVLFLCLSQSFCLLF